MQSKVLIVDDDPIMVISLKLHFSDLGIEFEVAGNGQEALEKSECFEPDIIISDIMMPVMDGYELRKRLRQNPNTAGIPFIFISAKSSIEDQMIAYRLGIDDYICKPFQINDLVNRMQRAIERARTIRSYQFKADFSGDLAQMVWTDLLQVMELNDKSGMLVFRKQTGEPIGKILFSGGQLVTAQAGPFEGEEAFYVLMTIRKGTFEFSDKTIKVPTTIKNNNTSLLLQGAQMIDEYKTLLRLIPATNVSFQLIRNKAGIETSEPAFKKWSPTVLSMIHKGATLQDILNSSIISPIRAASIMMTLLTNGCVKICKPKAALSQEILKAFSSFSNTGLAKIIGNIEKKFLTGVMEFENRSERQAVYFQKGQPIHSFHGKTTGKKALFRIFRDEGGNVKFMQKPVSVTPTIDASISLNKILQECFSEIELLKKVNPDFWSKNVKVDPQKAETLLENKKLSGLRYFIGLAQKHPIVSEIIDSSIHTDSKTYQQLDFLLNTGILEIENKP